VVCRSVGRSITLTSPANKAEPIDMPFGIWTPEGPRKHVVDGMHIDDTWRILVNRPCAVAMRLLEIILTTCSKYSVTDTNITPYTIYSVRSKAQEFQFKFKPTRTE